MKKSDQANSVKENLKRKKQVGKQYQKDLKKNASPSEIKFKSLLTQVKKKYFLSFKVEFQKTWIDESAFYISDFYFSETKVTIELDGASHEKKTQKDQDKRKADYLLSLSIRTLRIANSECWLFTPDSLFNYLLRIRAI